MRHSTKIAFIVEGAKTEPQIFTNVNQIFFKEYEIVPLILPSCTNIYTLWRNLKDDDDLDIIEVVKEMICSQKTIKGKKQKFKDIMLYDKRDFSEIYLFFDYDGQNNNLPKGQDNYLVLKELLDYFDNETENGKLYFSYPMIEAIKNYSNFTLCNEDMCFYSINQGKRYKYDVSQIALINDLRKLNICHWFHIITNFLVHISCMFGYAKEHTASLSISEIQEEISAEKIFEFQWNNYIKKSKQVMIISALPQFLLEYFKKDYLDLILGRQIYVPVSVPLESCPKKLDLNFD